MRTDIDVTFDFRRDIPEGKDPDRYSKTLRRYHKLLWSKPLPAGGIFELDNITPRTYLHHRSALGEFWLSSDAVIPSYKWVPHIKASIPQAELDAFNAIGYTIRDRKKHFPFDSTVCEIRGVSRLFPCSLTILMIPG